MCVCLSVCAQQHVVIAGGHDWPLLPVSNINVITSHTDCVLPLTSLAVRVTITVAIKGITLVNYFIIN